MNDDSLFYYATRDGEVRGPLTAGELKEMHRNRQVTSMTQTCLAGTEDWRPLIDEPAIYPRQQSVPLMPQMPQKAAVPSGYPKCTLCGALMESKRHTENGCIGAALLFTGIGVGALGLLVLPGGLEAFAACVIIGLILVGLGSLIWKDKPVWRCTRCRTFASLHASHGTSPYSVAKWMSIDMETFQNHYGHLLPHDSRINGPWST